MRPHANIRFWAGDATPLLDKLVLIHTPRHFDGFQVLHWLAGAGGRSALLSADQPHVCMDTRWVSLMYGYPNSIPLDTRTVERIVGTLTPYAFDHISARLENGCGECEGSYEAFSRAIHPRNYVWNLMANLNDSMTRWV